MPLQENSPKCLPSQELEILISELTPARGFKLHIQSVRHLQYMLLYIEMSFQQFQSKKMRRGTPATRELSQGQEKVVDPTLQRRCPTGLSPT